MRLVFERVSYRYFLAADDRFALRDVSFEITDGDFIGIIGHSGSGKSTLIQLAAALIQPTEGRVLLDGADLADPKNRTRLFTRIGVAFQYPEAQLFAPTVYTDIAFAAQNAGFSTSQIESRVRHWMRVFDLDFQRYASRSPFELSGGEQRRVALAGIMVVEPELLILDEPTAGLDPAGRRKLMDVIRDYHAAGNVVVMVSHSMEDIAQTTNRILVLKDGASYLQGTPEEVFTHADELDAINLGVPEPEALAISLRAAGLPLPPSLFNVDALADALAALGHTGEVPGVADADRNTDAARNADADWNADVIQKADTSDGNDALPETQTLLGADNLIPVKEAPFSEPPETQTLPGADNG